LKILALDRKNINAKAKEYFNDGLAIYPRKIHFGNEPKRSHISSLRFNFKRDSSTSDEDYYSSDNCCYGCF
jgi:hypothetical protein